MEDKDKIPAGSIPMNPTQMDNQAAPEPTPEPVAPKEDKPGPDDKIAKFEKMVAASQSMIGKQANEIGALRAKLDEMSKPAAGKSVNEQIAALTKAMDSGDIDIATGMQQALDLYGSIVADNVMQKVTTQQKQSKTAEVQANFLKNNPDYNEVLESGALNQYLQEDPLADEYTAFHLYKRDQKIANIQKESEAKIAAAKEEGAKLAKGAVQAGNVLGKQGSSAAVPQITKPFTNRQEAEAALMATLKGFRSASAQ